jgi:epoxyqueuosine reductase
MEASMPKKISKTESQKLSSKIRQWGKELGFADIGICDMELSETEARLSAWLQQGFHADMEWMQSHGTKRTRPDELVPGTQSIISVRMEYLPPDDTDPVMVLNHPELAYISRYALGRDYHKLMRKRLVKLAKKIEAEYGAMGYRVFVDSAPVMEKPIAVKAGLGWVGKHSNVLTREAGSYFFLGEIYTDLPLASYELSPESLSGSAQEHCGDCTACIDVCPTQAIVEPYRVDARLCISYLTIEHQGAIPESIRPLMGNRIYGCDDCQLICPWNRFAQKSAMEDFAIRHNLDAARLIDLFRWSEEAFLKKMEGSPIRRIGHERWLRNIAIALGNAPGSLMIIQALDERLGNSSELIKEHILWALNKQYDQLAND